MPEDNIVSEEESIVESDVDTNEEYEEEVIEEEVIVDDIDDVVDQDETSVRSRPKRTNAGVGAERLQMNFHGKGYGAKREF